MSGLDLGNKLKNADQGQLSSEISAELTELARRYKETSTTDEFNYLVQIEKAELSKHDYDTLLNMAASMSVLVNTVILTKPSREKLYAEGFRAANRHSKSKAGKARAAKDSKHQVLNDIVREYEKRISDGYNFNLRGRLTSFYQEMYKKHEQYALNYESIKNRIEKYRKEQLPSS